MKIKDLLTIIAVSTVSSVLSAMITCTVIENSKPGQNDYLPVMVMEHQRSVRI